MESVWLWARNAAPWFGWFCAEVLVLAGGGLAFGIPIALGTSRFFASLLYQVKPNDSGALAAAVGIILGAALVAGYIPAYRASRIDPMVAVRHE